MVITEHVIQSNHCELIKIINEHDSNYCQHYKTDSRTELWWQTLSHYSIKQVNVGTLQEQIHLCAFISLYNHHLFNKRTTVPRRSLNQCHPTRLMKKLVRGSAWNCGIYIKKKIETPRYNVVYFCSGQFVFKVLFRCLVSVSIPLYYRSGASTLVTKRLLAIIFSGL